MRRVALCSPKHCRDARTRLFMLGLALCLVVCAAQQTSAQGGGAVVRPEPSDLDIGLGQGETVDITLENAQDVYGIDVRATFDPAVVEVIDADATRVGIQMIPGAFVQPDFMVRNVADNDAGTLQYVITQVNPTLPANGTGVLFSVQFRGKALGARSELEIAFVEIADRNGSKLAVQPQHATLAVVSPKPETPTPEVVASIAAPAAATVPAPAFTPTTSAGTAAPLPSNTPAHRTVAIQPNSVTVLAALIAVAGCMGTIVMLALALFVFLRRRSVSTGDGGGGR